MTLLVVDRVTRGSVRNVSMALSAGERLALVGPGGDAVLDMIAGTTSPTAGRIRLGDDDVTRAGERGVRRLGVGRTVRRPGCFASMTVRETVQLALLVVRGEARGWWRPTSRQHRSQADTHLDRVGLLAHAERGVDQLDLPARRRLDLALALAHRPRLLLLDDPVAGLRPGQAAPLLDLIRHLTSAADITMLLAVDDPGHAPGWADRTLFIHAPLTGAARKSPASGCSPGHDPLH